MDSTIKEGNIHVQCTVVSKGSGSLPIGSVVSLISDSGGIYVIYMVNNVFLTFPDKPAYKWKLN